MANDLAEDARAAVAAGDRRAALQVLAKIGSGPSASIPAELTGLLGDALIATAAAKPTAEDAAAIAAYLARQSALDQILLLLTEAPLDPADLTTIQAALRRGELAATIDVERQTSGDDSADPPSRRVGRGWLEAKLIRGYGPYWYWRFREGKVQRSRYLGKAPLERGG
jgi:hypothetical protein